MAKRGNDKFRHQPHPDKKKFHKHSSNPHIAVKKTKNISKQEELFERYKEDLGNDYSLNDILEVGYPIIEAKIDIIASGKPNDVLQELHIFLLESVNTGLDTKLLLAQFLVVSINDFILDELFTLLENGLIAISEEDKYRVTAKGDAFVAEQKFIPVTSQEEFTFFVDGFSQAISDQPIDYLSKSENRLTSTLKVDFQFVQENWMEINKCFTKSTSGEKEIVDLANFKRSFVFPPATRFKNIFILIYYPKDLSGKKIQIKAYSNDNKFLKTETATLIALFSKDKFLFDFSKELELTEEFKAQFIDSSKEIEQEKKLAGEYKDISTFEHKELIREALLTAELAVYIESPWIRRATMEYFDAIKFFLEKKNTKLFITYGIDSRPTNAPHRETFEALENLRAKYKDRFFLWHLPTHFQKSFPNRHGSHRKILIKDYEYYVKGSFNWLSYSGNETDSYAVEEGTQFFDNVKSFWQKIFSEYKFDLTTLSF